MNRASAAIELLPGPDGVYSADAADRNRVVWDAFMGTWAQLHPGERAVLLVLARRLLAGQAAYGPLDLSTDRRDWRRERAAELADALIYGAIAEVASTLTTKGTP